MNKYMTIGLLKGINAPGHKGWTTVKCSICKKQLDLFDAVESGDAYVCPKCNSFFCAADAKRVKYRCPYCRVELQPYY